MPTGSVSAAPLRRLLKTSSKYRRICWRASLFSVLNKVFDIAPEVLIGIAVDVVVQREDSFIARLGFVDPLTQIAVLAVLTFFIWAFESLFEYLYSLDWRNLAQTVQHELRLDAYAHVQQLDVSYFEDKSTGSLVSILNDDINQLERFLDGGANSLIQVATAVIVIGGIFFYLAPSVAIWAMLPIPGILAGAFWYQKRAEPLYAQVRDKAARLGGKLASNLTGITTIKSQTAESFELERVCSDSLAYLQSNRRAIAVSSAFIPLIRIAVLAGFLATLILGGRMTINGELAVGSYGVLVFLTQRLLWPLTGLAQTVDLYQRAMASTQRVLDLLHLPVHLANEGRSLPRNAIAGTLSLEQVSFAYANRDPVLEDLNLHIPAGSSVALVGATGSGKSTIAKLLLRFYEPQKGRITLDGTDIRELQAGDLRHATGFVGQDVFLFDGTVAENIAYGRFDSSLDDIIRAAQIAHAHEFISTLPEAYDTRIGERGIKLSGGQRQRLAIARAVLKDPRIMILDEATSAVDNESERLIQKALDEIAIGRTVLIIAHRLSTVRRCSQIHVMQAGKIIESGTHEQLLAKEGQYALLWQVQTGHMRIAASTHSHDTAHAIAGDEQLFVGGNDIKVDATTPG